MGRYEKGEKLIINDNIEIDFLTGEVHNRANGKHGTIKPTGRSILKYLYENANHMLSVSQIFEHVWKYDCPIGSKTVKGHISKLREVMRDVCGKELADSIIVTNRGSSNAEGHYSLNLANEKVRFLATPLKIESSSVENQVNMTAESTYLPSKDKDNIEKWKKDFYALQTQDILNMSAMPWMARSNISYHLVIPAMLVSNMLYLSKKAKVKVSQSNFINSYSLDKNLAIIGNAGSGKSTLMYCLYLSQTEQTTDDLNIFADPRWFIDYNGE